MDTKLKHHTGEIFFITHEYRKGFLYYVSGCRTENKTYFFTRTLRHDFPRTNFNFVTANPGI